jgi:DNA polymerase I-like protein with 3'-5' exonuclease and polymerase domains
MQIAARLEDKYGWKAERNPKTDKPICDVAVMQELKYPEAKKLLEYREVDKLRGQLEDWIARAGFSRDGRIHGGLNTLGTVTGRTAASQPNIQQVSGDPRARALWTVAPGMVQVGCDLSGLELRALAHYMFPYDDGEYADIIMNGDIHTANQKAAQLETRDQAKTFIYALIYGGGNGKIGSILGQSAHAGGQMKKRFFKAIPALKKLIDHAGACAEIDGAIELLDGRSVPVRSEHKALNVLLQGCGAIISKWWCLIGTRNVRAAGLRANQIGFIHDEVQWECHPDDAAALGKILEDAAVAAGEYLNIRMPINAEHSVGNNWADCH